MALARPHPRMVNLTTASLEPAPLSSGWKSGSLPTGFTPTILREPGRAAATPPASKLKEKTGRGWGKGLEGRGLNGGGSDRGGFFPGRSVPSHARERKGRGGGDGRGEGRGAGGGGVRLPAATARWAACACAPLRHFRAVRFGSLRPILKREPWSHGRLRSLAPAERRRRKRVAVTLRCECDSNVRVFLRRCEIRGFYLGVSSGGK